MKKALRRHGNPEAVTTDGLRSYKAAMSELGNVPSEKIRIVFGMFPPFKSTNWS
jgi:transposase-like protein